MFYDTYTLRIQELACLLDQFAYETSIAIDMGKQIRRKIKDLIDQSI